MKNKTRLPKSSLVLVLLSSIPCTTSMLVPARGKCLPKGKASSETAKVHSLNGDRHAMIIGSQAVARKDIIAQSIIQGDSQVDVRCVVLPDMLPRNVLVQSSPGPRMPSGMSLRVLGKNLNGKMINARLKSMKSSKARKAREKALSPKANQKGRLRRNRLLQDRHSLHRRRMSDPNPNPNQKHVPA